MQILEITEAGRGRIRLRLDNGIVFLLYKKEAARYAFCEGNFVTEEQWEEIRTDILLKRAKKRAMYLLQKMDRTERQLRDKLSENEYPQDIIDGAVAYVKSFYYIDDAGYAERYVRCYQDRKSRRQMRMDLLQKGVSSELIDRAMEEALETEAEELIFRWLQKKHFEADSADEAEKRRVYQFLLRKGFHSDEILRCMRVNA